MFKTTIAMGTVLASLYSAAPLRADARADAQAVIDKAIKSAGGEANLAKLRKMTWKERGTYYGAGEGIPFMGDYAQHGHTKFRMDISGVFVIVINGDQGWVVANAETRDMTPDELKEQKEQLYSGWVTTLVPLKDPAFELSKLADAKLNDREMVVIAVKRKDHRDVRLYFDRDTGLLAKSVYQVHAPELDNKEVDQEVVYDGYQDVAGGKHPSKVTIKRDGKPFVEAELYEIEPMEKLDDKLFSKP